MMLLLANSVGRSKLHGLPGFAGSECLLNEKSSKVNLQRSRTGTRRRVWPSLQTSYIMCSGVKDGKW